MTGAQEYIEARRERLAAALEGVNLSRLAALSGVSRHTLWRIRTGRTEAEIETIDKVEGGLRRMRPAA